MSDRHSSYSFRSLLISVFNRGAAISLSVGLKCLNSMQKLWPCILITKFLPQICRMDTSFRMCPPYRHGTVNHDSRRPLNLKYSFILGKKTNKKPKNSINNSKETKETSQNLADIYFPHTTVLDIGVLLAVHFLSSGSKVRRIYLKCLDREYK